MTAVNLIRVVVGDAHPLVRAGLRAVLGGAKDIRVIAEASEGEELVALAEALRPDVIVMDPCIDPMARIAVTRELVDRCRPARIVLVTTTADVECVTRALAAGAAGVLSKVFADRDLVDAVQRVARGETVRHLRRRHAPSLAGRTLRSAAFHQRADHSTLWEREGDAAGFLLG